MQTVQFESVKNETLTPIYEPHTWASRKSKIPGAALDIVEAARDIGYGIETLLGMIVFSQAERGCHDQPLMSVQDEERLLRLALVSARLLSENADRCASAEHSN